MTEEETLKEYYSCRVQIDWLPKPATFQVDPTGSELHIYFFLPGEEEENKPPSVVITLNNKQAQNLGHLLIENSSRPAYTPPRE